MAEDASSPDLFWVSPQHRGIIPLDEFHISKSLRKTAASTHPFSVRVDTDFDAIIEGCATAGTDRDTTWINSNIRGSTRAFPARRLPHGRGLGRDHLVGGLYGVSIGAAFFGESMFHRKTDARKIAMAHLIERLRPAATACSTPSSSPITFAPSAASRSRARSTRAGWPKPWGTAITSPGAARRGSRSVPELDRDVGLPLARVGLLRSGASLGRT